MSNIISIHVGSENQTKASKN